jgi:phosphatidylserine decarboxylase
MKNNGFILTAGLKPVVISGLGALFSYLFICTTLGVILTLTALYFIYSFRNTSRHIYTNKEHILSPVDGKIEAIDYKDNQVEIYCKIDPMGLKTVKSPVNGDIIFKTLKHGLNLSPWSYKGDMLNTQALIEMENINIRFIAGLCNFSLMITDQIEVSQGDDILIANDGVVKITLKKYNDFHLNIGDKVTAGQTILAKQLW